MYLKRHMLRHVNHLKCMRHHIIITNNLQFFFQLKSFGRARNSICSSGVNDFDLQCFVETWGLQTAPRVKIIQFTPSVHNLLLI
jgi:hypothetical protein